MLQGVARCYKLLLGVTATVYQTRVQSQEGSIMKVKCWSNLWTSIYRKEAGTNKVRESVCKQLMASYFVL